MFTRIRIRRQYQGLKKNRAARGLKERPAQLATGVSARDSPWRTGPPWAKQGPWAIAIRPIPPGEARPSALDGQAGPGLHDDLVPRLATDHRRDIRMPPVMAAGGVFQQRLRPVDPDLVQSHGALPANRSGESWRCLRSTPGTPSSPDRRALPLRLPHRGVNQQQSVSV